MICHWGLYFGILFFYPQDTTIKGISRGEISSFLCLKNFPVVYCNRNSLLSINHIKGGGLGAISLLHVLTWVKEKSRGTRAIDIETISISCAVSVAVECQEILFSLVSSTNHNLSQRSFSFWGPWRHEPEQLFLWPCNFPLGRALRLPPFLKSAAYFKEESLAQGGYDLWVTSSPWYHGHRGLFSP